MYNEHLNRMFGRARPWVNMGTAFSMIPGTKFAIEQSLDSNVRNTITAATVTLVVGILTRYTLSGSREVGRNFRRSYRRFRIRIRHKSP